MSVKFYETSVNNILFIELWEYENGKTIEIYTKRERYMKLQRTIYTRDLSREEVIEEANCLIKNDELFLDLPF